MTSLGIESLRGTSSTDSQHPNVDVEEAAYQGIMTAILERRLRPGTKLGEQQLAETFDISRARVRRILLRLVQDRVVTQHPHRGAYVAEPSLAEARDLMQVRRTLEEKIVTLVTATITPRDIAEINVLIEREVADRRRGDLASALRVGAEFHLRLAQFAGNRVLYNIVRDLVARSSLVIAQSSQVSCPVCPADDHPGILDAIGAGDAARAARTMDEHLRNVERSLWLLDDGRISADGAGPN